MTEEETARCARALVSVLTECGERLDSVSIPRFGNFEPVKEDERVDVDLSTGKRILLPPSITMTFASSATLRKAATKKGGKR